jgi:hypothetical protein
MTLCYGCSALNRSYDNTAGMSKPRTINDKNDIKKTRRRIPSTSYMTRKRKSESNRIANFCEAECGLSWRGICRKTRPKVRPNPALSRIRHRWTPNFPKLYLHTQGASRKKKKTQLDELYCRSGPLPYDSASWAFCSSIRLETAVLLLAPATLAGRLIVWVNDPEKKLVGKFNDSR